VEIPTLRSRFLAGGGGSGRTIDWAHVGELMSPWEWLGRGHLLMTNATNIPVDAPGQVAFVRQLVDSGVVGLAVPDLPSIVVALRALLAEAEQLRFPVLGTAYHVPWIAIAQAVAQANQRAEQARMTATMRIYEVVREAAHRGPSEVVRRIGANLGTRLHVVDRSGHPLLGLEALDDRLRDTVSSIVDERAERLPAVLRVPDGVGQATIVPMLATRFACLVARHRADRSVELSILQHVAAVVAIELERSIAQQEERRRRGGELLEQLIERRIDAESGSWRLSFFDLGDGGDGGLRLVAIDVVRDDVVMDVMDRRLRRAGLPNLQLVRASTAYVLVPESAAPDIEHVLDNGPPAGLSGPITTVGQVPDAAKEARWALEASRVRERGLTRYGDDVPPFLPRTVTEAGIVADQVVGVLVAYDAEHGSDLVGSLRQFLAANRSWQRAEQATGVPKQTLVYRMRRVEQLTGRRLDDTEDVMQIWLALKAYNLVSLADEPVRAAETTRRKGRED